MGWGKPFRRGTKSISKGFGLRGLGRRLGDVNKALGQTQQNIHRGWDTTRGVADDVVDLSKKIAVDTAEAHRQVGDRLNPNNVGNLQELFHNPTAYGRGVVEPIVGNGRDPGLWDKYGGLSAMFGPAGLAVYGIGQGINMAYDYDRTGDEDQARDQARQTAATVAASTAAQSVGAGMDPGYARAGTMGATAGTINALGSDKNEEQDVLARGAVGGLGGLLGEGLSGRTAVPMSDEYGNTWTEYHYNPNSLNLSADSTAFGDPARSFGSQLVGQTYNAEQRRLASKRNADRYAAWQRDLAARLAAYDQGTTDRQQEKFSAPALEERAVGTPLSGLFSTEDEKKRARLAGHFGMSPAAGNSQIEQVSNDNYIL